MYVLTANATSVAVLSLAAPGQAKNVGSFDLSGPAKAAGLVVSKLLPASLRSSKTDKFLRPLQPPGNDHVPHPEVDVEASEFTNDRGCLGRLSRFAPRYVYLLAGRAAVSRTLCSLHTMISTYITSVGLILCTICCVYTQGSLQLSHIRSVTNYSRDVTRREKLNFTGFDFLHHRRRAGTKFVQHRALLVNIILALHTIHLL